MEILVQSGFRVIRGLDWSYKNQGGGKGHAGTVLRQYNECRPNLPKHSVLVQWDNGDKGLYRVGYDQAFDLRIIDTANAVSHPRIWCDGCDTDEIKGMRWRCTECYATDLCTTCYMNNKHNTSHVFMRVMSSGKSSMGPKMLPRSSSPRTALRGSFPGATVVRYPQWFKRIGSEAQVGKVIKDGQTSQDRVKVQAVVEFMCKPERVDFIKMSCTLPAIGGHVYEGHLPSLGDAELINEGDKVLVTATPAELEKLHKRRGLWKPDMAQTSRMRGFVNKRTNSGDFKVTFNDTQETFTMNSKALRKLHSLSLGRQVRISDDIEMVKRLQSGHGGWTAAMKKELGKIGTVVEIDGLDIHVELERGLRGHKFIFNSANLTPEVVHFLPEDTKQESFQHFMRQVYMGNDPEFSLVAAVVNGDIPAVENILRAHPDWVHYEIRPGASLLYMACGGCADMVKLLVEKGAFIDRFGGCKETPLFRAAIENNLDAVKYLLEKGADVNAENCQGFTILSTVCNRGFFQIAHFLLMHGADINQKGEHNMTPLLHALEGGSRTVMDLIMDNKETDLKVVSKETLSSAMHNAADKDSTYALTKLIDKVPRLVDAKNKPGLAPIYLAARKGCLKAAEVLIKKGHCDVNTLEEMVGMSALAAAISERKFRVVDLLVKNGADPNLSNHLRVPSMHIAALALICINGEGHDMEEAPFMSEMKKKWGHIGIKTNADALLAFLVSHGGDLNAPDCINMTVRGLLERAQFSCLPSLLEIQAQTGKDITKRQSIANRPLRNLTKKSPGNEPKADPVTLLLNKGPVGTGLKKQSAENSTGFLSTSGNERKSSKKTAKSSVQQKAAGDRRGQSVSQKRASDTSGLQQQLKTEIQQKDDELKTLRSRVQTLKHLVKKKITFSCGHDVIRSIAELIPECPNCSEPITSVVDLL